MVLFVQLLTRTLQFCGSCSCAAKRKLLRVRRLLQQSVPFLGPRFLVTNPRQTNSSSPHTLQTRRDRAPGRVIFAETHSTQSQLQPSAPFQISVSFSGMGEKLKCKALYIFTQTGYFYNTHFFISAPLLCS